MTAPRPSLFARIDLLTVAISFSLVTTIGLIGLLIYTIQATPSQDELLGTLLTQQRERIKNLPPPDRFVTISFYPHEKIVCDGSDSTFEQLLRRAHEENWNERTQVNIAFAEEFDWRELRRAVDVVAELRKRGISRIEGIHHSASPSAVIESGPASQR